MDDRTGPGSITLTTPWYPTPSRPMGGSFVASHTRLLSRIATDVSVIHGEEWAGGPPDVVDRIRPDFERVVQAARRRGGLARTGAVGPLLRVPVLITGGMDVVDRAEALVRGVSQAVGGRIEADVVHGHVGYLGGLVAARLALPGSRVFATEHSTGLRDLLADPRGRDIYAEVIARSSRLLCVSDVLRQQVLDVLPEVADKVEVLGNPVDVDAVPRRTRPLESLQHWLFSGGLIERKGVMRALEAFIVVAGRDPAATFTLLGEGQLRAAIVRRAGEAGLADRVRLLGMVSHPEALRMLREHDLLVAPSTYETFHLVIPEAIAAGIPVIATRSGGPQEVLAGIEDRVGRLVDVSDDAEEIVAAHESLTARLGSLDLDAGRDSLRDRYGPATIARRLADLYGGQVTDHQRTPVRLPRPAPPATVIVALTDRRSAAVRAETAAGARTGQPVMLVAQHEALRGGPNLLDLTPPDVAKELRMIERGKTARAAAAEKLALGLPTNGARKSARTRLRPRRVGAAVRSTAVRILPSTAQAPLRRAYRLARRVRRFAKANDARSGVKMPPQARLAAALRTEDVCLVLGDALSAPFVIRILEAFPQLSVCIELDRDGATSAPPDSGATEVEPSGPHVVMLVANDIRRDTRVRKSALAVAAAGARVTVVGYASQGRGEQTALGPVTLLRVPVEFTRRDQERQRRLRRRMRLLPTVLTSGRDDLAARRKLAIRDRQAILLPPSSREREGRATSRRRAALRGRAYAGRRAERFIRRGWAGWDKVFGRIPVAARWQHVLPEVDDYEMAFGPVVDDLRPDAIHAHDMHMVGVAALAAARATERGDRVPWVYDAHEWVPGLSQYGGRTRRLISAWSDLEADYIGFADRVVTVSPALAAALQQRHCLPRTPDVVRNIPPVGSGDLTGETVRDQVGLGPDVPLLVYSGGVQAARGVDTALDALLLLPEAHLVVVAVPSPDSAACRKLSVRARAIGVADRFHLLPPVAPDQVATFLRSADVGLIPLLHYGSHEMALANKLFEYLHAGVPAVVSDCSSQAAFVREHGTGEVHVAGNPASLAAMVRKVLDDPMSYRLRLADEKLLTTNDWSHEAAILQGVYRDLLPALPAIAPTALTVAEPPEVARSVEDGDRVMDGVVLGIGPANSAGQAWAWSRAAARRLPNLRPSVVTVRNEKYDFATDVPVPRKAFAGDTSWQAAAAASALGTWTHALLEAGRPVFGTLNGRDFRGDAALLGAAGVRVGLVMHGSEVRDPRFHAATHRWSPFADPGDPRTRRLQHGCDALLPLVHSFDGPVFVSTPDQLDYLPEATWLPVVVDTARWHPGAPVLERRVPLVVHAPSTPWLKGTEQVLATLQPFADEGRIDLRLVTGMRPADAAELIRSADIVVDQVLLGLYGVLACEAMCAGRLVLGNLGGRLRARVRAEVPVVEVTPADLGQVLERFLLDPEAAREVAARGPAFVERFHDGRYSCEVLADFLTTS